MAISIAKARSLCDEAELELVMESAPKRLATLSAARLNQTAELARKLRDKWLDQSRGQRRTKQTTQQTRDIAANARSEEKAQLFAEVLERFEKQLRKVEAAGAVGGKAKRQSPSRKARTAEHREKRAATREALQSQQEAIALEQAARQAPAGESPAGESPAGESLTSAKPAGRQPAKKQVVRKKSAEKARIEKKSAENRSTKKQTTKKKAAVKASKAFVARKKKATAAAGILDDDATKPADVKKKTLRAKTVAKQDRLAQGGAVRIQHHISARARRSQGRRDSRG
ncbi:MAG TPA: hypothetical protein DD670_14195 [Planctomycetaceae bacterium]|nr:hypothetical protein [Planctomycetaceae bacterium]